MSNTTLNLDKAATRKDGRSKRQVAVGRAIDMGIAEPALPWATVCVEHSAFGLSKTRGIAMVTVNPDFCDTCAPEYEGWVNTDRPADAELVKGLGTVVAKPTPTKAKKADAATAAKKPLPLTSKAKSRTTRKAAVKPVENTIEEVVIDGGPTIKVTRVPAPAGAKAPYTIKDGKVVIQAENWTKAKAALTAEPTAASVYDSTGREVARTKDGVTIETFAAPAETVAA